jgi:23S rRNA (adenine2503-C2)-methyltransferase
MPSAKKYKVDQIMNATKYYFNITGRRINIEYAIIEVENDSKKHINKLIELVKGHNVLINLIPLNASPHDKLYGVSQKKAYKIQNYMKEKGINTTVRRTLGADIEGACGQLRARELNK